VAPKNMFDTSKGVVKFGGQRANLINNFIINEWILKQLETNYNIVETECSTE